MLDWPEVTISRHQFRRNVTISYLVMSYGLAAVFFVNHGWGLSISGIISLIAFPVVVPLGILLACGNCFAGYLSLGKLAVIVLALVVIWGLLFAMFQVLTVRWRRSKLRNVTELSTDTAHRDFTDSPI